MSDGNDSSRIISNIYNSNNINSIEIIASKNVIFMSNSEYFNRNKISIRK